MDPNPKAFEAILMGTVPIIKHFPGDSYFRKLPVVLVDEWYNETISLESLKYWLSSLRIYYESHEARARVIRKLESAYWWNKVQSNFMALMIRWKKICQLNGDKSPTLIVHGG